VGVRREENGGSREGGLTLGQNWNCSRSPALAVKVDGKKAKLPFASLTWITCVITIPLGAVMFVMLVMLVAFVMLVIFLALVVAAKRRAAAAVAAVDGEKRMLFVVLGMYGWKKQVKKLGWRVYSTKQRATWPLKVMVSSLR
jgi:hypothetical protein